MQQAALACGEQGMQVTDTGGGQGSNGSSSTWPFHPASRAVKVQLALGIRNALAPVALWVIVTGGLLQL